MIANAVQFRATTEAQHVDSNRRGELRRDFETFADIEGFPYVRTIEDPERFV